MNSPPPKEAGVFLLIFDKNQAVFCYSKTACRLLCEAFRELGNNPVFKEGFNEALPVLSDLSPIQDIHSEAENK